MGKDILIFKFICFTLAQTLILLIHTQHLYTSILYTILVLFENSIYRSKCHKEVLRMNKQYVKQCPYCNSVSNHMAFHRELTRMVSECDDCGYIGQNLFTDIEKSIALQVRMK